MTTGEERLAVLETRMTTIERLHTEASKRITDLLEKMEEMITRHDSDLRILNEERLDRKNIYKMMQAAAISEGIKLAMMAAAAIWFVYHQSGSK